MNHNIWEPACGSGELSERLKEYGFEVVSTDLFDRGYKDGISGIDFLKDNYVPKFSDGKEYTILTNPPYNKPEIFLERALEIVKPFNGTVIMFLKLQFLESKKRRKLFDKHILKHIYVFSERILCAPNGDWGKLKGSAIAYAWYEFKNNWMKEPTVSWI